MKNHYLLRTTLLCWALFISIQVSNAGDNSLLLKTGKVTLNENLNSFVESAISPAESFNARYYRIIQFYKTPDNNQKAALALTGVKLLNYLPENAFYASFPFNLDRKILYGYGIKSIVKVDNAYKLCESLLHPNFPSHALSHNDSQIDLVVQYYNDIEPQFVFNAFAGNQLEILSSYDGARLVNIRIDISKIQEIASLPYIKWMEISGPESTPDDTKARGLHRSNTLASDYAMGRHYDGTGVNVALGDDGIVGPHIDFTGRLDNSNATGVGPTHGDMTGGILAGCGNLNPIYRGMATGAFVYNYNFGPYNHLTDMPVTKTTLNIRLGSTSYSQGTTIGNGCNEYNTFSQTGDQILHQNPELLWIFSAGNNGPADCYNVGTGGWGNITGGYKNGKNVIACANLNYLDVLEGSSSRGPANDGRIKPDISANGIDQMSTDENNTYQVGGGTSAACPGIAGITAQLYQAYRELHAGADPEACLLKACMLNTAEDLGNIGPDFQHGWGRINALRAVKTLEENRYMSDSISQGGSNTITINVPPFTTKFKVMLYWLDVEGDPVASKSLVNDLDLTVTDPSTVLFNPYILDPTPNPVNLNTPAITGTDDLNNVEQVELNAPANGTYTITVSGTNIPMGPQKYYIVYELINDEITVTYPTGGESFVPGETETIRWDSFGPSANFDLEYSSDSGLTWNTIALGVPANQRYYNWVVPNTITGLAITRITRGTVSSQSEQLFSIMDVPNSNLAVIDYACVDSMQISWPSLANATSYEVFNLGAKYMESIGITTDTFFVISTNYNPTIDEWFSISAYGADQAKGRRSIAFNKQPGLQNCNIAIDISLLSVFPSDGTIYSSCDNLTAKFITVDIKNEGLTAVSNVPVSFTINGGTIVTDIFPGPLNPGAHVFYNFASTYDFTTIGTYDLVVYINDTSDQNGFNDTLKAGIETIQGIYTLPWSEDFESFDLCSVQDNCELTVCGLKNGFINEVNGSADDIDWRTNEGPTFSGGTGPDIDHKPGTATGNYLYTEASNGCTFRLAQLLSPCIDLTGSTNPKLQFWYHMYGVNMGEMHVDIYANAAWITDIIPTVTGDQGNVWKKATLDLTPYAGTIVKFRFRGITGADFDSDMAIDDISVTETPAVDAGINSVSPSNGSIFSSCDDLTNKTITINIQNDGLSTLSNTPVYYQINGGTILNETFPGPLSPGVNASFTFTATFDFSTIGLYDLTAWINDTTDVNLLNDTIHSSLETVLGLFSLPWNEDFETFDLCNTASDCQATICGLKNGFVNEQNGITDDIDWRTNEGPTPTNNSGPDIDHNPGTQTGNYLYTEASGNCFFQTAAIVSPCIDLTATTNPELSYWYHMYGPTMGEMHTDIFANGTWTNDVIPAVNGDLGDVWFQAIVNLSAYVGDIIKFRIRGITGPNTQSDMAIDDLGVYEQTGVADLNSAGTVFVSPNPGNGIFNLAINKLTDKQVKVLVTDLQGREVFHQLFVNNSATFHTKLDLSTLAKGIYTLQTISGGKIYKTRLCIM